MAVALLATYANFIGTGVASDYAAEIYANSSDQIFVYVNGAVQTIGDNYVLNNVGSPMGITVHATFPLNAAIYIERDTARTQEIDTQNNETILEEVLDLSLDKLTMIAQEIGGLSDRAILVPRGEEGVVLPSAAARAHTLLGFDANGAPMLVPFTGTTSTEMALFVAGLIPILWPDIADGAARPAAGSRLPFLSGGVLEIAK